MDFVLSLKDIEWVTTQYPGLKINFESNEIVGDIYLNRSYNGVSLTNIFSIKVILNILPTSILPKVYETSGKLEKIADSLKIVNIEDIHVNSDKSLCLAIYDREHECFSNQFTIVEFFENCLEPYFFWISYYEKFQKPPWSDYSHGNLGIVELYSENRLDMTSFQKRIGIKELSKYMYHYDYIQHECLCGRKNSMQKCHPLIYQGLSRFKNDWKSKSVS